MWKRHPEVLVVGAGPVGLLTALALTEQGREVEVIDAEWRTGTHSYALALHGASVGVLANAGLGDALFERSYKVSRLAIYRGATREAELSMSDLSTAYPFIAVLAQDQLEDMLEQTLSARGVRVRWNHRLRHLDAGHERVHFEVDALEKESTGYGFAQTEWVVAHQRKGDAAFVIGADGHRSAVRRLSDVPFEPHGPEATFAVFEVQTRDEVPPEMRVILGDDTTSVYWPMGPRRCRWSFQIHEGEQPSESERTKARLMVELGGNYYPYLNQQELDRLLAARAPWFSAEVQAIDWSTAVRFQPRLVERFGSGRVWVVGDAAHVTGPAGVQSMNVGFRESVSLARLLSAVLRGEAGLGVLQDFERERQNEWQRLLNLRGGLKPTPGTKPWIGQNAARLTACIPATGSDLESLAAQIGLVMA